MPQGLFYLHVADWTTDGYRWRQSGNGRFFIDGVEGKKVYFYAVTGREESGNLTLTKEFRKNAYFHPNYPNSVVVQYVGDESVAGKLPHGNAKHPAKLKRPYVRTLPSVIRKIEKEEAIPSMVYRNQLMNAPKQLERHLIETPRDMEQVRNAQNNFAQKYRLSRDALFNLTELAHDSNFIESIIVHPDVEVFGFDQNLLEKFNGILRRKDLGPRSNVRYHFQTGGFLCFRIVI